MKTLTLALTLYAAPLVAQDYTEADARMQLSACLKKAEDARECVGAVIDACVPLLPEDDREYVALTCGDAEFGAWYEAMQGEAERAFRAVEAFEAALLSGGINADYVVVYQYLSEAQQSWEAYVRAQCAIAPQVAALMRKDSGNARACEREKYAARIAELRAVVANLN